MQSEHGTSLLTGSKCEDIYFTLLLLRKYLMLHLFIFRFVIEVGLEYKFLYTQFLD